MVVINSSGDVWVQTGQNSKFILPEKELSGWRDSELRLGLSMKVKSLSCARLFASPWIVACTKLLRPWDFQGKSTGAGCHFLLQGIFPTQGSNPGLPHCRQTLYCLSHQGNLNLLNKYILKLSFFQCLIYIFSMNYIYLLQLKCSFPYYLVLAK